MGNPKRTGKFGIARTASASGTATPKFVLVCDDANVTAEPFNYERVNNVTPDDIGVQPAGFNMAFNCSGAEVDPAQFGYIMWLALGDQSIVSLEHVIVPGSIPQYLEAFADRNVDLGSSTPTETEVGAMITNFSLDIQKLNFAKLSFNGIGCAFGSPAAALVASLPAYPLSWHALRAGDFKIGYNLGALASDRKIMGLKIDYSREISGEDDIELDSDQPSGLTAHSRSLEFEITRKFEGAAAQTEYAAWKNQVEVGFTANLLVNAGAHRVFIEVLHGRPTGSYAGPVGAGDDSILGTLKCKAFQSGADPLIRVTVKDATTIDYT